MAGAHSVSSDTSHPTQDISHCLELQQYKECPEALLEHNLDDFYEEVWVLLWSEACANGAMDSPLTDAAIKDIMSMFGTQL